jgi:hypothetical protein
MNNVLEKPLMKVTVSIAKWFPKNQFGEFMSINSVYQRTVGTPNEIGLNTLRLALNGTLDRGHMENLIKLARLCSMWSGERVTIDDLMVITDD